VHETNRAQILGYVVLALVVAVLGARYLRHGAGAGTVPDAGSGAGPAPAAASTTAPPPLGPDLGAAAGGSVVVDVAGAVRRPGVYKFAADARVQDAVRRAGGPTRRAVLSAINLAARVVDGQQIVVPVRGGPGDVAAGGVGAAAGPGAGAAQSAGAGAGAGSSGEPGPVVDLNTASEQELEALDGVGPAIAQKILDYRQEHGGFRSVDDLDQVSGIGPKKLAALRSHVRV